MLTPSITKTYKTVKASLPDEYKSLSNKILFGSELKPKSTSQAKQLAYGAANKFLASMVAHASTHSGVVDMGLRYIKSVLASPSLEYYGEKKLVVANFSVPGTDTELPGEVCAQALDYLGCHMADVLINLLRAITK